MDEFLTTSVVAIGNTKAVINEYLLGATSIGVASGVGVALNENVSIRATVSGIGSNRATTLYSDYMSSTVVASGDASVFTLLTIATVVSASVYPDVVSTIPGVIPFQWQYEQRVLVSEFADGSESRRLSWQSNKKSVAISYRYISRTQARDLYEFYRKMEGPLTSFSFFFPNSLTYYKEFCGTYTGTTSINLPSLSDEGASVKDLYAGNTLLVQDVDYKFYRAGSYDGGDRVELLFTPVAGSKFFWSFTGRLKVKARFEEGPIQINEIKDRFSSLSVELVGLESEFV